MEGFFKFVSTRFIGKNHAQLNNPSSKTRLPTGRCRQTSFAKTCFIAFEIDSNYKKRCK